MICQRCGQEILFGHFPCPKPVTEPDPFIDEEALEFGKLMAQQEKYAEWELQP